MASNVNISLSFLVVRAQFISLEWMGQRLALQKQLSTLKKKKKKRGKISNLKDINVFLMHIKLLLARWLTLYKELICLDLELIK